MALTKSGDLLKTARLKKGLTIPDVERATRIRGKFLEALEEGNIEVFSSTPYARGFLKNYADFLGLNTQIVLAVFRRETSSQQVRVLPHGMGQDRSSWFRVTPTRAAVGVVIFILAAIGYFLFEEYRGFLGTPRLSIEKPAQEIVKEGELEVAGKADIDSTVLINGEPASVEESGRFSKKIDVFKGETTLTVVAKNRRAKETTLKKKPLVE